MSKKEPAQAAHLSSRLLARVRLLESLRHELIEADAPPHLRCSLDELVVSCLRWKLELEYGSLDEDQQRRLDELDTPD